MRGHPEDFTFYAAFKKGLAPQYMLACGLNENSDFHISFLFTDCANATTVHAVALCASQTKRTNGIDVISTVHADPHGPLPIATARIVRQPVIAVGKPCSHSGTLIMLIVLPSVSAWRS